MKWCHECTHVQQDSDGLWCHAGQTPAVIQRAWNASECRSFHPEAHFPPTSSMRDTMRALAGIFAAIRVLRWGFEEDAGA